MPEAPLFELRDLHVRVAGDLAAGPILRGVDPKSLSRLWLPFVLINLGCALRVAGQTATDFADWVSRSPA